MKIINLTPHVIVILKKEYTVVNGKRVAEWVPGISFPPSGTIVTCIGNTETEAFVETGNSFRIPLTYTHYTPPDNLPPQDPSTLYIVSELVAQLCPHRQDFRIVNGVIRDDNGRVIGCRSLGRIKPPISPELIAELRDLFSTVDDRLNNGDTDDESVKATNAVWNTIDKIASIVTAKG